MKKILLIIIFILFIAGSLSQNDILVFQGQFYENDKFQTGEFNFVFNVYDNRTSGNLIYSNSKNLTTGRFGEWYVELEGIHSVATDSKLSYFMEIIINDKIQGERRRLTQINYMKKEIDQIVYAETTFNSPIKSTNTSYFNELFVMNQKVCLKNGTNCLNLSEDFEKINKNNDNLKSNINQINKKIRIGEESNSSPFFKDFGGENNSWARITGDTKIEIHPTNKEEIYFNEETYIQSKNNLTNYFLNSHSMSFFIKTTQKGSWGARVSPGLFGYDMSYQYDDLFWGWIHSNGNIGFTFGEYEVKSIKKINDGGWHHIVVIYDQDNNNLKIFIDGILDNKDEMIISDFRGHIQDLGRIDDYYPRYKYFNGFLKNFNFYEYPISEDLIWNLSLSKNKLVGGEICFEDGIGCPNFIKTEIDPIFLSENQTIWSKINYLFNFINGNELLNFVLNNTPKTNLSNYYTKNEINSLNWDKNTSDDFNGDYNNLDNKPVINNFWENYSNKIFYNFGNIGIGTNNPKSKLNINGTTGTLSDGISFGDGDTGFYENIDDQIILNTGKNGKIKFTSTFTEFGNNNSNSPHIKHKNPSSTSPNIIPLGNDSDTGIGHANENKLSLIAGGIEGIRISDQKININKRLYTSEHILTNGNIHPDSIVMGGESASTSESRWYSSGQDTSGARYLNYDSGSDSKLGGKHIFGVDGYNKAIINSTGLFVLGDICYSKGCLNKTNNNNETNANLSEYYKKNEIYNKNEINSIIDQISNNNQNTYSSTKNLYAYLSDKIKIKKSWTNIYFDNLYKTDTSFNFIEGNSEIEILEDGLFDIHFECTAESTASRFYVDWRAMLNNIEIPGTRSASYHRMKDNGRDTASISFIHNFEENEILKFQGISNDNNKVSTVQNGCRIKLKKIYSPNEELNKQSEASSSNLKINTIQPTDPSIADIYFDSKTFKLMFYNGYEWKEITFKEDEIHQGESSTLKENPKSKNIIKDEEKIELKSEIQLEEKNKNNSNVNIENEENNSEKTIETEKCEEVCENICLIEEICEDSCENIETCEEVCETNQEGDENCKNECSIEEVCENICENIETCEEVCEKECENPEQLFDIKLNLEENILKNSSELIVIVTYENFGNVPTPVDLTFEIFNESNNLIYKSKENITVTIEEVRRYHFNELKLKKGKYKIVFTTLYNVNIKDEFIQYFEIKNKNIFSKIQKWFSNRVKMIFNFLKYNEN